ncbi:MAG: PRC-barrel domain-containing protein [Rhodothermales bacterium]
MKRVPLSNTGSWELSFDDQDVRGYEAVDADGNHVGEVDQMIVNTDEKRVDAIVLEDGTEYPARDISIGDGVVYLTTIVPDTVKESVTVYDDYGHVVERDNVEAESYDEYAGEFRNHYKTAYAATGNDFDTYDPAYRFGYETAYDESYRNRPYTEAESDLERSYTKQYPNSRYDDVRDAVRYGYASARGDRA